MISNIIFILKDIHFFTDAIISFVSPRLWKSNKILYNLKGCYKGKRCFIMGNGPSLNKMPLERLAGEIVWGVNRCYLLYDRISWRPMFFTAVDTLVVPNIASELNDIITSEKKTLFFFPYEFCHKQTIRTAENVIWFRHRPMNPKQGAVGYFSKNVFYYLRIPNTVTITAMQLAAYMGFNPIILIGCDMEYKIPKGVKRSGNATDPGTGEFIDGYEIISYNDNDPNHFDPKYFGKGHKWHFPNISGMIFGYRNAKQVCNAMGIKVYNATPGGRLEVFPRISFKNLDKIFLI